MRLNAIDKLHLSYVGLTILQTKETKTACKTLLGCVQLIRAVDYDWTSGKWYNQWNDSKAENFKPIYQISHRWIFAIENETKPFGYFPLYYTASKAEILFTVSLDLVASQSINYSASNPLDCCHFVAIYWLSCWLCCHDKVYYRQMTHFGASWQAGSCKSLVYLQHCGWRVVLSLCRESKVLAYLSKFASETPLQNWVSQFEEDIPIKIFKG